MNQYGIAPRGEVCADPQERRGKERVRLPTEVRWDGLSGRQAARLYDVSQSGCYIESPGLTQPGERTRFTIQSPTGRWLHFQGEVVHSQTHMGFGVRFLGISELRGRVLDELIDYARAVSDDPRHKPAGLAA